MILKNIKWLVKAVSASFLIILLFSSLALTSDKAPEFRLADLNGKQVALKDLLGKGPIVLDFWATWCKPCVKYLPKIQEIYEKYEKEGLVVLGINQDSPSNRSKINPFVKSLGITFPILIDENSRVARKYQVYGLPSTIVISADGKVVKTHRGYRPGDEKLLEEEIVQLLLKDKDNKK